jgi:hypothetical protein
MLLAEVKAQLEAFRQYAHEIGKDNIADQYAQMLFLIDAILEEKGELAEAGTDFGNDSIYQLVMEKAARFGKGSA